MTLAADAIELDGRRLRLSNLDKVLWPAAGFRKRDLIDFYVHVAPALLPHLADRPVALRRFPDGVEGVNWYQLQWPRGHPGWLASRALAGRSRATWRFCVIDDAASLVWAANLAAIELHPYLVRAERPEEPIAVVFDLDPGEDADLADCARVALRLRALLDDVGLASFAKMSGSLGLHVHVPLDGSDSFAETKAFARESARLLAAADPSGVVDRAAKAARRGKVLVDWAQNARTRSTVAPYSLRAAPWPTVSTPLAWDEVEAAAAAGRAQGLAFGPRDVLARLDRLGDLHAPLLELRQRLPR